MPRSCRARSVLQRHPAIVRGRGRGNRPLPLFFARTLRPLLLLAAALVAPGVPPCRAGDRAALDSLDRLRPPASVEEARTTILGLADAARSVDAWVESHWEREFAEAYPDLSNAPRRKGETAGAAAEREARARLVMAEFKKTLRGERVAWIEHERRSLLETVVREPFAVRLGDYDVDRGEFPLLLGYGWPTALSIRLRVRGDAAAEKFRNAFPQTLTGTFRVDAHGELFLESLGKGELLAEAVVVANPPAPRLLWRAAHESWVTSVAFRPDGAAVLSAGADGAIHGWDAETGVPGLRLGNVEMAMGVAFTPDGRRFATAGADSVLRLRDGADGRELWKASAPAMIFSVSASPDGRFLATGDDGGWLRVWDAQTGRSIAAADLGSPVRAVAFAPDGRRVAAGLEGNAVLLWDALAGRPAWRREMGGPVYAVATGGEDGLVAAGGGDGRVTALREADGSEVWSRPADGEVRSARFDGAGRLLAVGSGYSGRVLLAETGEPVWSTSVGSPVRAVAPGPTGLRLAVGSSDFGLRIFEVDEGDRVLAAFCGYGRVYVRRDKVSALLPQ